MYELKIIVTGTLRTPEVKLLPSKEAAFAEARRILKEGHFEEQAILVNEVVAVFTNSAWIKSVWVLDSDIIAKNNTANEYKEQHPSKSFWQRLFRK